MPEPKAKAKPKTKPLKNRKLTQKERFIEAARAHETDETGETFERMVEKILPAQNP
tara:strand:+ start:1633 stop:1800 length:168 start_codon:yes stop_codon:yes gene_type:complete